MTERKPHLLKNGAPAHKLTTEDRRKGAATTNARRRTRAVEAADEPTQHNSAQRSTTRACDCPRCRVSARLDPFHDGRHSSITNAAAAGTSPAALMARAGHSDFKTTQGYIDLAGETFREEAELLEERLFGQKSGQK